MSKQTKGKPAKPRGRAAASRVGLETSQVEVQKSRTEERKPDRAARVPMTNTLKLQFNGQLDTEKFYYRWFKEEDGRLGQAQGAYYDHVIIDGAKVKRQYKATTQYLMQLPIQYRKDDQKLKEGAIKGKLSEKQTLAKDEYLPDDRHHALEKDDYDPLAG